MQIVYVAFVSRLLLKEQVADCVNYSYNLINS